MQPALLYHEDFLAYNFGKEHALREIRVKLARDLIAAFGLVGDSVADELRPDTAREADVLRVHEPGYVAKVKELSADPTRASLPHGLGTPDDPVFGGMYEASALQVGATLRACEEVATGRRTRAFNLGGGFHHAMPAKASGFCIFNDLAIGIVSLLEDRGLKRVLYVDVDAHHGDGVQSIFYRDPRVLTISFHEDGRFLFPGTGFIDEIGEGDGKGFAANVPLPPYTRDASYVHAFEAIVPPLARAFRPEVIVSQFGADAHYLDPLTHLMLTTAAYEAVGRLLDELSTEICGGRWIAAGGGGYDVTAVPRVWTVLWSAIVRRPVSDALPEPWLRECKASVGSTPADRALRDRTRTAEEAHVQSQVRRTVEGLERILFPIHGIH